MELRQNPMVQSANKIMSFNHTLNLQSAEKIYRKRQKWYLGIYMVLHTYLFSIIVVIVLKYFY